jgi:hypothetical protein
MSYLYTKSFILISNSSRVTTIRAKINEAIGFVRSSYYCFIFYRIIAFKIWVSWKCTVILKLQNGTLIC